MEYHLPERLRDIAMAAALAGSLALSACSTEQPPQQSEISVPATGTSPTTAEQAVPAEKYAVHDNVTSTLFWIGEAADDSNGYISNVPTAWDENAATRYGGFDGSGKPDSGFADVPRDEHGIVTDFVPKHNPYYFALPAGEFNENGLVPGARERSPWANESVGQDESLFKGRWIKVTTGDRTTYAQWLDVGPNEKQDYDYVFGDGTQPPKNTFGLHAGLDLSPAAAAMLGYTDGGIQVSWQFVDALEVPEGPWSAYPPIDNKTHWS
jgi:hypothetical protein